MGSGMRYNGGTVYRVEHVKPPPNPNSFWHVIQSVA
jgi:hypothetical protein